MGQNNKLMSLLVNILLSCCSLGNIWGYCSPPRPFQLWNVSVCLVLCCVVLCYVLCYKCWVSKCIVISLALGSVWRKSWHLDLNLMNKWWCHGTVSRLHIAEKFWNVWRRVVRAERPQRWRGHEREVRGGGVGGPGDWRKGLEKGEEETPADLHPSEPAWRVWWGESARKLPGRTKVAGKSLTC